MPNPFQINPLQLPCKNPKLLPALYQTPSQRVSSRQSDVVLFVGTDMVQERSMRRPLERDGLKLISVTDATSALSLCYPRSGGDPVRAVILDVDPASMGWMRELSGDIKSIDPSIGVLVYTSLREDELWKDLHGIDGMVFLGKGIENKVIRHYVDRLIARSKERVGHPLHP